MYPEHKGDFVSGSWFDIPTPVDTVLRSQKLGDEVQRVFWAMAIGRMLTRKDTVFDIEGQKIPTKPIVSCMTFFHGWTGTGETCSTC